AVSGHLMGPGHALVPWWTLRIPRPRVLALVPAPSGLEPELIERAQQFGRIAVDAIGSGAQELGFPVAATQQPDAQNPRAARRELIPDGIADDVAFARRNP